MKKLILLIAFLSCNKPETKVANCDEVMLIRDVRALNYGGLSGYIWLRIDTIWRDPNACGSVLDSMLALPISYDYVSGDSAGYRWNLTYRMVFKINFVP